MAVSGTDKLLALQRRELTTYRVYNRLAGAEENADNRRVLLEMAQDQLNHWAYLKSITRTEIEADEGAVNGYTWLARLLGHSFALKHMQNALRVPRKEYIELLKEYPQLHLVWSDQERHEKAHLSRLREKRLVYAGAVVLGLNDAIVEFTGALSGFTFALGNGPLIGLTGLIMGIAASLSMAASGYQESREEGDRDPDKNPIVAAACTGGAYFATVLVLISPYFVIPDVFAAMATMLAFSVLVILAYTFYITTAKGLNFKKRFLEMAGIALTVALISFLAGYAIKQFVGIDI